MVITLMPPLRRIIPVKCRITDLIHRSHILSLKVMKNMCHCRLLHRAPLLSIQYKVTQMYSMHPLRRHSLGLRGR